MSEDWDNTEVVRKFAEILDELKQKLGAEETLLDVDEDGVTWSIGLAGKIAKPSNPSPPLLVPLDQKFKIGKITVGQTYYTDRDYSLTAIPVGYLNLDLIKTPNDEREDKSASGYIRFSLARATEIYVGFDSRTATLPQWLTVFDGTGKQLKTSLDTQPALNVYARTYDAYEVIDLGGCYGPSSSSETRSNYIVFGSLVG